MQTHIGIAETMYAGLRNFDDLGWWRKHVAAIGAVTKDEVIAASQRYDPSTFCVVLVGDPAALDRLQLQSVK